MNQPSPRQRIMEIIGKTGCYFLSLIYIAESYVGHSIDATAAYEAAVRAGYMEPDCYILRPDAILRTLVGGVWSYEKVDVGAKVSDGASVIVRYERKDTTVVYSHFVVGEPDGTVIYDPLGNSQTVELGRPISLRVFRRKS